MYINMIFYLMKIRMYYSCIMISFIKVKKCLTRKQGSFQKMNSNHSLWLIKKSRMVIMKSSNKNDLLLSMVYNFSYFNIHCTAGSFCLSGNSCITMCPSPSRGDIHVLFLSCPTIWLKSLYVHLLYFKWALHFCLFITTWRTTFITAFW